MALTSSLSEESENALEHEESAARPEVLRNLNAEPTRPAMECHSGCGRIQADDCGGCDRPLRGERHCVIDPRSRSTAEEAPPHDCAWGGAGTPTSRFSRTPA
jgi:hypothetical protein